MISFFPFVFLFTFVTCEKFHPNQHLPVQKYQPPLRYQPLEYYPNTYPTIGSLPYYRPSPTKEGIPDAANQQQLTDLERQYQHWQIASSNGQQPGVIWISAPQYSYYPPPPNGSPPNYPPPPYYPSPYPPPYPPPTPETNQTQSEIQEVNPTQSRETVPTKPSPSESVSVESSTTTENYTSPVEPFSTFPPSPSTTESPWTSSPISETTTLPPIESSTSAFTTTPAPVVNATESYTNATTEFPTTTTTPSFTSPTTTQNTTIDATTVAPNTTSNATNPLSKYCKKPRGQFPSDDCSKFINCWDDTVVEQTCPSGLYFNANKSYCDYPSNVNCSGSTSPSSTEPSTSSSSPSNTTSSKCPSSYGTYRNSSNCAAFYVCVAGEPVDFHCPPGTNYNDELKVCDYPYRVNCSGIPSYPIPEESVTTEVTETTPSNITTTESSFNVTTSSPNITSSPNVTTSSPNVTTSAPNVTTSSPNVTSSPNITTSSPDFTISSSITTTTTEPSTSTVVAPQVTEEPFPSVPPPSLDPVALYNFNLKKLPESVVNTGVRCYHSNIFRLTPDCSSVTVCQDGLTYIVNCGHDTSFDAYSQKCVSSFRARC